MCRGVVRQRDRNDSAHNYFRKSTLDRLASRSSVEGFLPQAARPPLEEAQAVESRKGARPGTSVSRWFPFPAHQTGRAQLEHPAFRLVSPQRPRKRSDNTAPCDGTPDTSFALRQQLDWEHSEPQRLSDFRQ